MNRECKKCLLYESAQADTLTLIKEKIEKLSPGEKASVELYEERLSYCKDCDFLLSGTCMKCGCYVELRAAFKEQRCANASDRKW